MQSTRIGTEKDLTVLSLGLSDRKSGRYEYLRTFIETQGASIGLSAYKQNLPIINQSFLAILLLSLGHLPLTHCHQPMSMDTLFSFHP